ncbi:lipopolysaccharide biosynthesis protein [Paenibacillus tianjinensis]|uniref:Oligosaccharide flippase family protein n=1 Tax=Paenibacillus tianjinensis TaxID=2810347 RepID=A0ABX7LCB6_9BACL|nr:oligosaccharide flippase family protein [Paenibacillus tianjinensis]QSF44110.1 oligosaccharide flippase family protein [Paenibacillus tianjinensis]
MEPLEQKKTNILARFGKDTLAYIPAILIPAVLGVLSLVIFTRMFSPLEYGQYALVLTSVSILSPLISQWLVQSIQKFRPQYEEENNLWNFNQYIKRLVFYIILFFAIIFMSLYPIIKDIIGEYKKYYFVTFLLVSFQSLFNIGSTIYQSEMKVKLYGIIQISNAVLKLIISIGLYLFFWKNTESLFWGMVLSFLILIVPMYYDLFKYKETEKFDSLESFKEFTTKLLSFGFPMIGWFLGLSLLNMSDRYLLEYFKSASDVGIYSANNNIVTAGLGLLCGPLITAAHPIIMNVAAKQGDTKHVESVISNFSRIFLLVVTPVVSFVTVYRDSIVKLLLGEEFREGAIIIPILLVGYFAWNFAMYGHKGYEILGKTKRMLLYVLICVVVNAILNIVLIPRYSYLGASLATLIALLLYPIIIYFTSKKHIKWNISILLLVKLFLIAIFLGIALCFSKNILSIDNLFLELFVSLCLSILYYGVLLMIFKELKLKKLIYYFKKR